MSSINNPVTVLRGVALKRAQLYNKLGIFTPYDLICHFPRSYIDFSQPVKICESPLCDNAVIRAIVTKKFPEQRIRSGLVIYKAVISDSSGEATAVFYNNVYAFGALKENEEYCFYGKVTGNLLRREINSPQYIPADSDKPLRPLYHLTSGLTNNILGTNISESLKMLNAQFEYMPREILEKNNLCGLWYAFKNIHFPENQEAVRAARRRLAFNELLCLQLGIRMIKQRNVLCDTKNRMDPEIRPDKFYESLPFILTNAQKKAVCDIFADMCREIPMNRLLQGDVGSGKTVVAAAACWYCVQSGYQSALMAPTEILAGQHYQTLSTFLVPLGIRVVLLTGSMSAKQKKLIKQKIADKEYDVIVGTHAIIQKDIEFNKLGLVITDEQHRFGVAQRAALALKGDSPHKLVMSATPIPRTLGLIIYGDLDITIIDELPSGRVPVETFAVTGGFRKRVYGFIKDRIDEGRQAYIVCSVIEQNETEMKAASEYAENLKTGEFSNYRVSLLHGKMSPQEKNDVMSEFKDGRVDLLVCTTVIEVGVDVPNAAVIVIEDADRFGLSQLHQLRGRVGRGKNKSYCVLITDNKNEETRERLKVISSTTDGFKISEEDLRMRGPGDFFGNRQHGLPYLKIADIASDTEMLAVTQNIAKDIMTEDSELKSEKYTGLRNEVLRMFSSQNKESFN
ncbi:MAG: ATP-dependent DNA helicase RecG [Oscillospiraceae bacterium]|nr:ATP-dependent DNA helicase RecG [Oscillospiraceae bacterium]